MYATATMYDVNIDFWMDQLYPAVIQSLQANSKFAVEAEIWRFDLKIRKKQNGRQKNNKMLWYLDLAQCFQIWSNSVLIKMNYVRNNDINNFEYHNQIPKVHRFLSRSL